MPVDQVYSQGPSHFSPSAINVPLQEPFYPAVIKGLTIDPKDPLHFDFIIDTGDDDWVDDALYQESEKLIKYFMTSLTVPDQELWVNLSPYEKNRIVPEGLGSTQMGVDMLSQDYQLKQMMASMMSPDEELGSVFWERVYQQVYDRYGTVHIDIDTFNKVWIIPEKADIYIEGDSVFVSETYLKVMLEKDYIALADNRRIAEHDSATSVPMAPDIVQDMMRDIFIPAIEKEVNEGARFATLRQIYHSLILATWYKENLQQSLLGVYYADSNQINGVDVQDKKKK